MYVFVSRRSDQSLCACTHNALGCAMRRDISERHRDRARVLVRKILDLDTVSNRGVVAACASQISSFIIHIWHIIIHICHIIIHICHIIIHICHIIIHICHIIIHMCHIIIHKFRRSSCSHRRAESVNVLAHPRKKGNVVHASDASSN